MFRALTVAAGAAFAATVVLAAPAHADSQVTVRGTGFPEGRVVQQSLVGCESLYGRHVETLAPYVSRGPDSAPLGQRSLGFDPAGGNAVGSMHYVDSMSATSVAGSSVHAREGTTGVAYAGYQSPVDAAAYRLWIGRAAIDVAPGRWQYVDAPALTYTWTQYDMRSGRPVTVPAAGGAARVPAFLAAHGGDGAGFYSIGFGCDGRAFNTDAWRVGRPGDVTTYDLEGLTTVTTISGPQGSVEAGDEVRLSGSLGTGSGAPISHGTLILEAKGAGAAAFAPVEVVAAENGPSTTVTPTETTTYRWRFVDRPLAEGSVSGEWRIEVEPVEEPEVPPAEPEQSEEPESGQPEKPGQRERDRQVLR